MKNKAETFYLTEIFSKLKFRKGSTTKHKSYSEALESAIASGKRFKIYKVERVTLVNVVQEQDAVK